MKGKRVLIGAAIFALVGLQGQAHPQGRGVELLLPGDEYLQDDLPDDPTGLWWVLHRTVSGMVLELLRADVRPLHASCIDEQPEEQSGRAVSVPDARDVIVLVRGAIELTSGPVETVFTSDGASGKSDSVRFAWGIGSGVVRHLVKGDEYVVELGMGEVVHRLHTEEWHGDGQWEVRWVGDLNRDGWPDILVDASHKYSVYTTRLVLSGLREGRLEMLQVAKLTHFAC